MTRSVVDAELEVYNASNSTSTPNHTVTDTDLEAVQVNSRLQNLKDKGQIHIDNTGGAWDDSITIGDKLRLRTQLDGDSGLSHRWTGVVQNRDIERTGPSKSQLRLRVTDFVFGVLSMRLVYNAFEKRQIAGPSSAIVNTVVANEASEIDRSKIQTVDKNAWVYWNGKSALNAVVQMANEGNAIVGSDDTSLIFRPLGEKAPTWALQSSDYVLPVTRRLKDVNFANHVRVAGGTGTAVADEQTTKDGYTTVTESSRITHQLSTAKSEIARVEVWTKTTGSGEDVTLRLQSNQSGAPWDKTDPQADIARKTIQSSALASDGLTTFILPRHGLPDPDPWIIIESSGSSGQDIGVNTSTSAPRFTAYYSYELATQGRDQASINEYRRRETKIRNDNLQSTDAADAVAQAKLNHDGRPESVVRFKAASNRAHELSTGDVIDVALPDIGADGPHIVVERSTDYDGATLTTNLVVQDTETV